MIRSRPVRRRPATTSPALAAVLATALLLAACSEPPLPDGPVEDTGTSPAPEAEDPADPDTGELASSLRQLRDTIDAASGHLEAAATAVSTTQLRSEADRALGLLLDGAGTRSSGAPVLPADTPDRDATGERTDLLSTTLALARDVGGDRGTAVVALLRDDLAGDLGAWERDAAGVVAGVERAARTPGDLERRTAAILELPGEATRALAWTLVAAEASDLDTATAAASRANAHLDLVLMVLAEVVGELPDDGAGS